IFFFQAEDGIRDRNVTGVQTCALPILQRIAIARAIFSERPVLILDESTSSLDETTEQVLLKNLRQMTDKTVLIITHRPAALEIRSEERRVGKECRSRKAQRQYEEEERR